MWLRHRYYLCYIRRSLVQPRILNPNPKRGAYMELSGSHTIDAPQDVVWEVLTDPETLRRTLPSCQKFELQPDGSYLVTMSIGIASIKGTYSGKVQMVDVK